MPGPIVHLGATVMCTHAGQATPTASFPRVMVSGQPVITQVTPYVIAGLHIATTHCREWAVCNGAMVNWLNTRACWGDAFGING